MNERSDTPKHQQPPRRRRILNWILPAVAALLLSVIWAVWRFHYDGADPRLIFWPHPPEPQAPAALDEIVSLHVKDRPFREVLAELAERHGVAIEVDDAAFKDEDIAVDALVTLDLDGVTLRTVLELLTKQEDDGCQRKAPMRNKYPFGPMYSGLIVVDRGGRVLITTGSHYSATLGNYVSRVHRLDALLTADDRVDERAIAQLIRNLVAPDTWSDATAAGGKIEPLPGALLIEQTPQAQRETEALLDALAQLQRQPDRFESIDVGIPVAARPMRRKILAALDQPARRAFDGASLGEVCAAISRRHGIPVQFEPGASEWIECSRSLNRNDLAHLSLRSALRAALRQEHLTCDVRDDLLLVTWDNSKLPKSYLRAYPVADLLDEQGKYGFQDFAGVVRGATRDGDWVDDTYGGGTGVAECIGGVLVVRQHDDVHRQIERLLAEIRHARRPTIFPASQLPEDVAARKIEAALAGPTTLEFHGTPLEEVVREIGRRHGIPVVVDGPAIGSVDVKQDRPVHLVARGVPLEHALRRLLEPLDLDVLVRDESLVITTREEAEENIELRVYASRALAPYLDADSLRKLIESAVEPYTWEKSGPGPGLIETFGDLLLVAHTRGVHRQVAPLLAALEQVVHHPASHDAIDVMPLPSPSEVQIREALRRTVPADFVETPLSEVLAWLEQRCGVPVWLDTRALTAEDLAARLATPITLRMQKLRLRSLLNLVLGECGLAWRVRNSALWITTPTEARLSLSIRVYPVGDLLGSDPDSSSRQLQRTVDQALGFVHYGQSDVLVFETSDNGVVNRYLTALVVRAGEKTQREVTELLKWMRELRAAKDANAAALPVGVEPTAPEARILEKLARPAELSFDAVPLEDALRRIAEQHELPLRFDARKIAKKHVNLQSSIDFSVSGVPLGEALTRLLQRVGLAYMVRDDVLMIALDDYETTHASPFPLSLRVYWIGDIRAVWPPVVPPDPYGWSSAGPPGFSSPREPAPYPSPETQNLAPLTVVVENCLHDWPGTSVFENVLIASGEDEFHEALRRLLAKIRATAGLQASRKLHNDAPITWGHLRDAGEEVRVYDLREALGNFPDLDRGQIAWLVGVASRLLRRHTAELDPFSTPVDARLVHIADLPGMLVVRHTAEAHAEIGAMLAELPQRAGRFPRPADLCRDDHREAVRALARRLAATRDPHELDWLCLLVTLVDYPTQPLADALVAQLARWDASPAESMPWWLLFALEHCGPLAGESLPQLGRRLAISDDQQQRFWLVATILAVREDNPAALGQLAAECRETELPLVLDGVKRLGPAAANATAGLLERLGGEHGEQVAQALRAIDPSGRLAWKTVQARLRDKTLTLAERKDFERLANAIRNYFGDAVMEADAPPTP